MSKQIAEGFGENGDFCFRKSARSIDCLQEAPRRGKPSARQVGAEGRLGQIAAGVTPVQGGNNSLSAVFSVVLLCFGCWWFAFNVFTDLLRVGFHKVLFYFV